MLDIRSFIEKLKSNKQVKEIKSELSTVYEIPKIMKELDSGPLLFFSNVKGFSIPVVSGFC
ncbi:MAG: menaquinone biosynthesis decarboxylase, partial [Candidatus Odinarchaeia archaeon]